MDHNRNFPLISKNIHIELKFGFCQKKKKDIFLKIVRYRNYILYHAVHKYLFCVEILQILFSKKIQKMLKSR